MLEAFVQGFLNVFHPLAFLLMIAGTIVGIIIGILPAIGPMTGLALILPFIYGLDPFLAFSFLLPLGSVTITGGVITTILLNIPGDVQNSATLLDGYPMTRKGEGGRAIGAALTASATGGVMGVLLALLFVPVVVPLVTALFSAEIFFIVLLGISFVAALAKGGLVKGFISGLLGLLLAFVGFQSSTGTDRFAFGSLYLFQGFPLIPVIMGLFAGAELVELVVSGERISLVEAVTTPRRQMLEGARDVFRYRWAWFRSAVIGYVIGILPGIGPGGSMFLAYGQAKQASKHPEKFGTGTVEGVIAPETATHACYAGDLLTTIAFGIPGSATMALILAAFILVGITPGPRVIIDHPDLSFTMLWTVAVAQILAAGFCFPIVPYLVRLTRIRPEYLFTTIVAIIFVSVFAIAKTLSDTLVFLAFTVVGILMNRFGYSRPALVLGFVLGGMLEEYFWFAVKLQGPFFFTRPISLALIAILIGLFAFSPAKSAFQRVLKKGKTG